MNCILCTLYMVINQEMKYNLHSIPCPSPSSPSNGLKTVLLNFRQRLQCVNGFIQILNVSKRGEVVFFGKSSVTDICGQAKLYGAKNVFSVVCLKYSRYQCLN